MINVIKLIDEVIDQEEQKKREVVSTEGITGWRSSGLGTCMRGRFLDRLLSGGGVKAQYDARTLRVFEMGNQVEEWMMNNLAKQTEYTVLQQIEMYDPDYNLSGHLDAFMYKEGSTEPAVIVECKSKQSKAFWYMEKKGEGAQVHHKMQLHSYLYMLNKHGGVTTTGTKIIPSMGLNEGRLVYVSKDDMAMLEYPVFLDDTELEGMWKYEIETLNKCWDEHKAPPANAKGSWQEKYCKFCEAGVCQGLTDTQVEEMFEIYRAPTKTASVPLTVGSTSLFGFKIGDRVSFEGRVGVDMASTRNGTVNDLNEIMNCVCIEFDYPIIGGHSGGGGKLGHCWWVDVTGKNGEIKKI